MINSPILFLILITAGIIAFCTGLILLVKASRRKGPEVEAIERLKALSDRVKKDVAEIQSEKQTLLEIVDQGKRLKDDIKKDLASVLMPKNGEELKDELRPSWLVKEGLHAKLEEVRQKTNTLEDALKKYAEIAKKDNDEFYKALDGHTSILSLLEEKLRPWERRGGKHDKETTERISREIGLIRNRISEQKSATLDVRNRIAELAGRLPSGNSIEKNTGKKKK